MELKGEAKLLRIFIGESDKIGHVPLYETIVKDAKAAGVNLLMTKPLFKSTLVSTFENIFKPKTALSVPEHPL